MLHSPVYNDCYTEEMSRAWIARDAHAIQHLITKYAQEVIDLHQTEDADQPTDEVLHHVSGLPTKYRLAASRLQVACSLYDSLRGGHTTAFVTDFINV